MKNITTDLAARLALLHTRAQVVLGRFPAEPADRLPADHASSFYRDAAAMLEAGLREGNPDAIGKVRAVVDPADMDRSDFWGTPLGRLLFVAGGFGAETCSQAIAAGVLGCSRQWVSAMVSEGKLNAAPRGVYVEQVQGVMQARAKRLSLDTPVK
jgi:hypothetical protein